MECEFLHRIIYRLRPSLPLTLRGQEGQGSMRYVVVLFPCRVKTLNRTPIGHTSFPARARTPPSRISQPDHSDRPGSW